MSSLYELTFRIYNVPAAKRQTVEEAISRHWPINRWELIPKGERYDIWGHAENHNSNIELLVEQARNAAWEAAGEFVEIEVVSFLLSSQPCKDISYDKVDYEEWRDKHEHETGRRGSAASNVERT